MLFLRVNFGASWVTFPLFVISCQVLLNFTSLLCFKPLCVSIQKRLVFMCVLIEILFGSLIFVFTANWYFLP